MATSQRQTAVLARGATGAGSQGWGHAPSTPWHKAGASHPSNADRHSGALSRLSFLKLPPDAHSGKAEGDSRGRRCAGRARVPGLTLWPDFRALTASVTFLVLRNCSS